MIVIGLLISLFPISSFASENKCDFEWKIINDSGFDFTMSGTPSKKHMDSGGDWPLPDTVLSHQTVDGTVTGNGNGDLKMKVSYQSSPYVIRLTDSPTNKSLSFNIDYEAQNCKHNDNNTCYKYRNGSQSDSSPNSLISHKHRNDAKNGGAGCTEKRSEYYITLSPEATAPTFTLRITYPPKANDTQNQLFLDRMLSKLNPNYVKYFDVSNSLPLTKHVSHNRITGNILCDSDDCVSLAQKS